jgi:spore maturation protein CgeB
MKTFELTVAGACVVSNFSEEQNEFFKNNHSIVYFNGQEEMVTQVKYYLEHAEEAKRIRATAVEAALPHSYHSRVDLLMKVLK